jgi:3-oxoacyl-[acyl-carrier-protein] synthase III
MKIDAVKVALPSRKLTNTDVLEKIRLNSEASFDGNIEPTIKRIKKYLEYSGSDTRYMLDEGETPIEILSQAMNQALDEAQCHKNDIDLLVYVGIGRGFIEPAAAYMVAHALDMRRVQCFDILDACNSWSRGVQIIYALLQTGNYKRAMLINAEFSTSAGRLGNYSLRHGAELDWTFPTYTIGEAATATILSLNPDSPWEFHFRSRPDLADLCTIPINGFQGYCHVTERIGRNGNQFTSYGAELFEAAGPELLSVFAALNPPIEKIQMIFPHAASKRASDSLAQFLGIEHLVYNIYPRCGNVVSCSVPAAMAFAIEEGRVKRGDLLVAAVASAGMSFSAYSFVY